MKKTINFKILEYLSLEKVPCTAYQIANAISVSWGTANKHVMELTINGRLEPHVVEDANSKSTRYSIK